jgi:hypothetical protein
MVFEIFLILRRIKRDMAYKVPVILDRFEQNSNFFDGFLKNNKISNFMKILPVRAELFQSERRKNMTKPIVALRNFANAPNGRRKEIL